MLNLKFEDVNFGFICVYYTCSLFCGIIQLPIAVFHRNKRLFILWWVLVKKWSEASHKFLPISRSVKLVLSTDLLITIQVLVVYLVQVYINFFTCTLRWQIQLKSVDPTGRVTSANERHLFIPSILWRLRKSLRRLKYLLMVITGMAMHIIISDISEFSF